MTKLSIKAIRSSSKKDLEDVVTAEILRHGKNKDFAVNIQEKLLMLMYH
jgi:hypothetical protein